MDLDDLVLESLITSVLESSPGETGTAVASKIITALALAASQPFVVTDPSRTWLEVSTPCGDLTATAPGCVHVYQHDSSGGDREPDYMHVCDLDDFIATLVNLREMWRRHAMGEANPVCTHLAMERRKVGVAWADYKCQACGWRPGQQD